MKKGEKDIYFYIFFCMCDDNGNYEWWCNKSFINIVLANSKLNIKELEIINQVVDFYLYVFMSKMIYSWCE